MRSTRSPAQEGDISYQDYQRLLQKGNEKNVVGLGGILLQQAIYHYKNAVQTEKNADLKNQYQTKYIDLIKEMITVIKKVVQNNTFSQEEINRYLVDSLNGLTSAIQYLKKLAPDFCDPDLARICITYVNDLNETNYLSKESNETSIDYQNKHGIAFCNLAVALSPDNLKCYGMRADSYYVHYVMVTKLGQKPNFNVLQYAFSDYIQVLELDINGLNNNKLISALLSNLNIDELIALIQPFSKESQIKILTDCLNENHVLGNVIKNSNFITKGFRKYSVNKHIEMLKSVNKLSDSKTGIWSRNNNNNSDSDKELEMAAKSAVVPIN